MSQCTAEQSREIARLFYNLSVSLGEYRFKNWDDLSEGELDNLESLESRLRNYASKFTAMAINISIDNLAEPLNQIKEATKKADDAVKKLNQIRKVITIAKKTVSLGVAIISKDPFKIVQASADLLNITVQYKT